MLSLSTHSESVEGPTETVAEVLPPPVQCAANVCTINLTLILGPATISIALCELVKYIKHYGKFCEAHANTSEQMK